MFEIINNNLYAIVIALIFTAYVLFRLIIRLIQDHANKRENSNSEDLEKIDTEVVDKIPGWSENQTKTATQFGLLNDREWTQNEYEIARKNGILTNNNEWSHTQFQKAKQLDLI